MTARPCGIVTLTTDFGTSGYHVGAMKGALLTVNSGLSIVDLCHGIPPGDIASGAWTLLWNWRCFPEGTIHLAVVDPGVGTGRRALAAAAGGHFFVGPDNGLLVPAVSAAGNAVFHSLETKEEGVSATFHGRDVFAPAAARVSLGETLSALGPSLNDPASLELPRARSLPDGSLEGEVIAIDPFGNLVTSITSGELPGQPGRQGVRVGIGTAVVNGIRTCYGEAEPGAAVAVINSSGHLEIAVNGGRADVPFGAAVGDAVTVRPATAGEN